MKNEKYTLVLKTAYLSQTGGIVIVNFCPTKLMEFNGTGDGIEPPSRTCIRVLSFTPSCPLGYIYQRKQPSCRAYINL